MYQLIERWAKEFPNRIAIVEKDEAITYKQMHSQVDAVCSHLTDWSGTVVPFCLESKLESILLMLACIKAELPFMPIDTGKTSDAICKQLGLVGQVDVLVGGSLVQGDFVCAKYPVVAVDREEDEVIKNSDLMSVMFTSGSTGTPKGVLVPKSAVVNLLKDPTFFELKPEDIFATYSPLAFDASTFEIFCPLLNGNTLICLDKYQVADKKSLQNAVKTYGITSMWFTAGLFNKLVLSDQHDALGELRNLFVGGDRVEVKAAQQFLTLYPDVNLFNGYGPTENTVFTTTAHLTLDQIRVFNTVPIGKPIDGVGILLLDDNGLCVEGDGEGRLLVSGRGLSLGYLKNSEANKSSFVTLTDREETYYDTGDRVAKRGQTLLFLGRFDRQVKIKGHRVDLNLVEQKIKENTGHNDIVVYLSALTEKLTLAYRDSLVFPSSSFDELSEIERPKQKVAIEEWPLNGNGKVDVKKITVDAECELKKRMSYYDKTAEEMVSVDIVSVVREVAQCGSIDGNPSLFDLGLDSISIITLQSELGRRFGVSVGLIDIYEAATLDGLNRLVKGKMMKEESGYYLQQTVNTNPGQYEHYFSSVPKDVEEIFRVARNVVEHHAGINSEHIPMNRYQEMEIDRIEDILEIISRNGVDNIVDEIPLENKVVGNCFNISKLAVSLLRYHGIPARIRYAYCTYFYEDFSHEQALVEYWDAEVSKWRRGDASMNKEIIDHLGIEVDIDLLNVSKELSQPIADVWLGCRFGKLNFEDYGASVENRKRGGIGHVAHKLTHDLACLNQLELMACDFIAPPANYLRNKNLNLDGFDNVARLLAGEKYQEIQYTSNLVPFCARPRRVLRKSRFSGVNVK